MHYNFGKKLYENRSNDMTNQEKVAEFMRRAGQEIPGGPALPLPEIQRLRAGLILEEGLEFNDAVVVPNIYEIADAIGDLLYVVYGAAVAYGLDAQAIFDEVHRSNMTKFIDGQRAPNGKWVKGPSYSPPDLKPLVE